MGQKVNPVSLRLGVNKTWKSQWFDLDNMPKLIEEDYKIRNFIRDRVEESAGISRIDIKRAGNENIKIVVHTDKPGVIIGKGGSEVENIKNEIEDITGKTTDINIEHIKNPQADAAIIGRSIATALEKKMRFRPVMKRALYRAYNEKDVEGVKVAVSGRLNGSEIARTEWLKEGKVPLQTIRADIDYNFCEANTTYGNIGIKVWVCKGEIIGAEKE
ncbi:MAG: 30S ribosomal protein S3 [Elusimicrobiota bacterium]